MIHYLFRDRQLIFIFGFMPLLLFFTACGPKKNSYHSSYDSVGDSSQIKTSEELYYVWVDNLRARKKPGLDGDIIRELKKGEKLIFLHEKSAHKETIQLRGITYEDFWLKVKLPGGEIGWVFGGAISPHSDNMSDSEEWLLLPGQSAGLITFDDSFESLLKKTAKQCKKAPFYLGEGEDAPGYLIYPGTHKEIECLLDEKGKIQLMRISHPESPWHTSENIRIGTTLSELVVLNGKPISLYGFGWDYGGTLIDFQGGKFNNNHLSFVFSPHDDDNLFIPFLGDQSFLSTEMGKLTEKVRITSILLPRPL
ncbi:MAG: SH3 domain-containing protein [Candidatus Competibacteraceae bacterium]|nr:SH3 domain-containing protein [Candidatus Competibacteraceae bacterium]